MTFFWSSAIGTQYAKPISRKQNGRGTGSNSYSVYLIAAFFALRREVISMPGFDGTGPAGGGPMTGDGRGYCNPGVSYGPGRSRPGRSVGSGYGRGRGYRHMFWETGRLRWARWQSDRPEAHRDPNDSQEDEVRMLKGKARPSKMI
jgi:hypothetical protein